MLGDKEIKTFLSIDFEDFSHDLMRDLSITKHPSIRLEALYKSYYQINNFLKKQERDGSSKATFFCTAHIAKKAPDLIKAISNEGHEIGCHYYYHDIMEHQTNKMVEKMLGRARDCLEDASNQKVVGFRAPKFRICKHSPDQYRIVQKYFEYDSSFFTSSFASVNLFKKEMGLNTLKILPIFQDKVFGVNMKMGGSYLKIFPTFMTKKLIEKSKNEGLVPHIYLHPYEFSTEQDFRLKISQMKNLHIVKKLSWAMRQHQWLSVGNNSIPKKLNYLIGSKGLGGRLSGYLLDR